jgi:hypothetical protein
VDFYTSFAKFVSHPNLILPFYELTSFQIKTAGAEILRQYGDPVTAGPIVLSPYPVAFRGYH